MIARLATRLNQTIASAARSAGVWTVGNSVRSQFVGYNACVAPEEREWIHAGKRNIGEIYFVLSPQSFHPKDRGQQAYAVAFSNTILARSQ